MFNSLAKCSISIPKGTNLFKCNSSHTFAVVQNYWCDETYIAYDLDSTMAREERSYTAENGRRSRHRFRVFAVQYSRSISGP